jgi:hypothetical protein
MNGAATLPKASSGGLLSTVRRTGPVGHHQKNYYYYIHKNY